MTAFNLTTFRFKLYLRLSIVAGMSWVMEVVSFLLPSEKDFFQISDIFNALQGVFIFVLFVIRRRVFCLIRERFGSFNFRLYRINFRNIF